MCHFCERPEYIICDCRGLQDYKASRRSPGGGQTATAATADTDDNFCLSMPDVACPLPRIFVDVPCGQESSVQRLLSTLPRPVI